MAQFKIFVGWPFCEEALHILRQHGEVQVNPEKRILDKVAYLKAAPDTDIILSVGTEVIDAEVMAAAPQLKMIANYAIGFNNIDVAEATKRGIVVTNTSGSATESTADFTWALLMAVARRVVEGDVFMRAGKFKGVDLNLLLGHDLHGSTLGIVGMGKIGLAVAERAQGFKMNILYFDPIRRDESYEREHGLTYASLEEVLRQSDFVSLHVLLTDQTHHLIGEKELSLMKSTAYLINASRGPVVDEQALVKVLREKRIAGAGLDVFENEPTMAPGLTELSNVVLAPHIASSTRQTRDHMAMIAARNIAAFCQGERPPNLVNPEVDKGQLKVNSKK